MQWMILRKVDIRLSYDCYMFPKEKKKYYDKRLYSMNKTRKDASIFFKTIRYKTFLVEEVSKWVVST